MAQINTQPVKFIASGLLSIQQGPNGVTFPVKATLAGGLNKQIRIQGIKVLKIGVSGSVEIFDSVTNAPAPADSVFSSDITETPTNLGINIKSGDFYVKITGGYVVYVYIDLNN